MKYAEKNPVHAKSLLSNYVNDLGVYPNAAFPAPKAKNTVEKFQMKRVKDLKSLCCKLTTIIEDIEDKFRDDSTFLEVSEIVQEFSTKVAEWTPRV